MSYAYDFKSTHYTEVKWKNILYFSGMSINSDRPLTISNSSGLIIMPEQLRHYHSLHLCFNYHAIEVLVTDLQISHFQPQQDSGIYYYQLNNILDKIFLPINLYHQFIYAVIHDCFCVIKRLFLYTYEHLNNRYIGNQPLTELTVIKNQFTQLIIEIEKIEAMLNCQHDLILFYAVINHCINILIILARLGGARCVLTYNALELLFHLKLFQKFIGGK